jgi:hypothetical protein
MVPKCHGRMKIVAFIDDEEVIEMILKHLEMSEDAIDNNSP